MAVSVSFIKAAKQDIDQAYSWYELRQVNLGDRFLNEAEQTLQLIKASPKAFPRKYRFIRVKLLNIFPYALFYNIEDKGNVRIYACLHLRRNLSQILKNR